MDSSKPPMDRKKLKTLKVRKKGLAARILGTKTADLWREKFLHLVEDPNLTCTKCGKQGAVSAPFVTWQHNMYWQVGSDPVGLIRWKDPEWESVLCTGCRRELTVVLEEAGDFFDP